MFDWILEFVPNVAIRVSLAPSIPLLVAHEAFLPLCRPRIPLLKIIIRALPLLHRGKVDKDDGVATDISRRLAIQKTSDNELLRSGIRDGCQ